MNNKWNLLKKTHYKLICLLLGGSVDVAFAGADDFFSIRQDCHVEKSYLVTICLNGRGPLSCQNYTVDATHLVIKTTIPQHSYAFAGIKVWSTSYRPTNCTLLNSEYCLFTVNDTTATTIIMEPIQGFKKSFVC